jgi:hypothetical protein
MFLDCKIIVYYVTSPGNRCLPDECGCSRTRRGRVRDYHSSPVNTFRTSDVRYLRHTTIFLHPYQNCLQRPFYLMHYKTTITTRPGLYDSLRLRFCLQNQPTINHSLFLSRTVNCPVKYFPDSSGKQLFSGLNTQT